MYCRYLSSKWIEMNNNVVAMFRLYIIKILNVLVFKIMKIVLLSQNLTFILNIRKYTNTAVKKSIKWNFLWMY